MQGKIIKGIAGFYYVNVEGHGIFECKAKGAFRKTQIKPLVGDDVIMDIIDEEKMTGNVVEILDRKSEMIRPACANVDQALIIFSVKSPVPNFNLLDRFLIYMEVCHVPTSICFNKEDLTDKDFVDEVTKTYKESGYDVFFVSAKEEKGIDKLKDWLKGKTTVVAGPSGVGKSSLINLICENDHMQTGSISVKNERGKHTTRHSELMYVSEKTYIMDTPGFTSLEVFEVTTDNLKFYYNEFEKFESKCKFRTCAHINEPVCGVKEALLEGKISKTRYDNYVQIYSELKNKPKY
ncbi:MAG: ribosome small subunit-dependent GTPase A [Lachnospiraceae bacterium]|nr:ribosome small subunit-dependent GTPase A [Lachnospiraceae bacterium]